MKPKKRKASLNVGDPVKDSANNGFNAGTENNGGNQGKQSEATAKTTKRGKKASKSAPKTNKQQVKVDARIDKGQSTSNGGKGVLQATVQEGHNDIDLEVSHPQRR